MLSDDPNIWLWGGTTSFINTSFPGFQGPTPITFTMWSFNTLTHEWDHYDMSETVKYRPAAGSYTEARDQVSFCQVVSVAGLGSIQA